MTTVVQCPSKGTYLVYNSPLPMGQTPASGTAVYEYSAFWECEDCGAWPMTTSTSLYCRHIRAVLWEYPSDFTGNQYK